MRKEAVANVPFVIDHEGGASLLLFNRYSTAFEAAKNKKSMYEKERNMCVSSEIFYSWKTIHVFISFSDLEWMNIALILVEKFFKIWIIRIRIPSDLFYQK